MKAIPIVLTLFCLTVQAGEVQIDGPRFDDGKYSIFSSISDGPLRAVIIKREGPFSTSYIEKQFDCSGHQYRYIGMGLKSEEIVVNGPDSPWFSVPQGGWIEGIRERVCLVHPEMTASQ